MQTIKKSLVEFFNNKNKENPLLFNEIMEAWKQAVDKQTLKNTEVLSINNKILLIKTSNPVCRNEMFLNKTNIIKKINKRLKNQTLKELKII